MTGFDIAVLLLVGAGAHLVQNWRAFSSYLRRPVALGIMGLGLAVTAVSLLPLGEGEDRDALRPVLQSVADATVPVLANLTGQSTDAVLAKLTGAGFADVTEASTIRVLAGEDMGAQLGAMAAVFVAD